MAAPGDDRLVLTDSDVDALAWQFTHSVYAGAIYAAWPLDRRPASSGIVQHR